MLDYGLDDINNFDELYHVGERGYDAIKNRKQQGKYHKCSKCKDAYNSEVSLFLGKITVNHIDSLVDNGFTVYRTKNISRYTISLSENIKNIESISVTSTPQQTEYNDLYYDERFLKVFGENPKKDKEYYNKWPSFIEEYKRDRKEYLYKQYGIKDDMSLKEYLSLPYLKDWSDMDKYVNINLEEGNKNQHASYIPHVQLKLKKPLIIKREEVLYK